MGYIIPQARYFLNRVRYCLKMCKDHGSQRLMNWDIQDLVLWKKFLTISGKQGIDMNHINFVKPTATTLSDACETGLGGIDDTGDGWIYHLPEDLQGIFSINLLEFMASVITVRRSLRKKAKYSFYNYLALSDRTALLDGFINHDENLSAV